MTKEMTLTEARVQIKNYQKEIDDLNAKIDELRVFINNYFKKIHSIKSFEAEAQEKRDLKAINFELINDLAKKSFAVSRLRQWLTCTISEFWSYENCITRRFKEKHIVFVWQIVKHPKSYWIKEIGKPHTEDLEDMLNRRGLFFGMDIVKLLYEEELYPGV